MGIALSGTEHQRRAYPRKGEACPAETARSRAPAPREPPRSAVVLSHASLGDFGLKRIKNLILQYIYNKARSLETPTNDAVVHFGWAHDG
jgi:hypothetical protein